MMPLRIELDYDRGVPVYRQIYEAVIHALSTGAQRLEERLPTIHELAETLRVNPNTVARSYRELERDGYVTAKRGHGTFPAVREHKRSASGNQQILRRIFEHAIRDGARHGIQAEEIANYFRRAIDDES
jgi:GntR family transcriptional regulator